MTDHGRTVYDEHHRVMHEQTGRRGSHRKTYDALTPKVRARYDAAGRKVAEPLEAQIADLTLKLGNVWDLAMGWTEISDQWGEPTREARAEADYGRQVLAVLGWGGDSAAEPLNAVQERRPDREVNLITDDGRYQTDPGCTVCAQPGGPHGVPQTTEITTERNDQ